MGGKWGPSQFEILGDGTVKIFLTHGNVALIDWVDLPKVAPYTWHTTFASCGLRYARTNVKQEDGRYKGVPMHRLIQDVPTGMVTDHINHNGLDNRRCNIRVATLQENSWNAARKSSHFAGVVYRAGRPLKKLYHGRTRVLLRKPWQTFIGHNGHQINLGCFATEEAAARAYNAKALELRGPLANLNEVP